MGATDAPVGDQDRSPRGQLDSFEERYGSTDLARWAFHDDPDAAIRYARDRRLRIALDRLEQITGEELTGWRALVVCGGVGGEGTYLRTRGLQVTVSDFSESALDACRRRDPDLETLRLDALDLAVPDGAYDLVLVQDGLHHLPNPVQGFVEMLRVAGRAVVMIEPHAGLVSRRLGREWEREGDSVNYVFRWDERLLEQVTRSFLLQDPCVIEDLRCWDYAPVLTALEPKLGRRRASAVQKGLYRVLNAAPPVRRTGNMMVAVVVKGRERPEAAPSRGLYA